VTVLGALPTAPGPTGETPTGIPPVETGVPPIGTGAPLTGSILVDFDPDGSGPEDSEIYLIDPNSGEGRPLTDNDVPDRWPSWAPDGTGFAFTRMRDGAGDIYFMDTQTGTEQQVTGGPDDDWGPNVALDGTIVFNSDRSESDKRLHDIWGIDVNGNLGFLVGATGADDRSPAWSPDNQRMAFTTDRHGVGRAIYLVDLDLVESRITFGSTIDRNPSWRPDGRGLVFTRNPDETGAQRDIWSLDFDTGEERPITDDPADEGNPVYSPDGRHIAFYRRVGEEWHIFLHEVDSGEERDLTASLGGSATDPSWR
jgi:TolB protein